jgi:hypothetical protein
MNMMGSICYSFQAYKSQENFLFDIFTNQFFFFSSGYFQVSQKNVLFLFYSFPDETIFKIDLFLPI